MEPGRLPSAPEQAATGAGAGCRLYAGHHDHSGPVRPLLRDRPADRRTTAKPQAHPADVAATRGAGVVQAHLLKPLRNPRRAKSEDEKGSLISLFWGAPAWRRCAAHHELSR